MDLHDWVDSKAQNQVEFNALLTLRQYTMGTISYEAAIEQFRVCLAEIANSTE